MSADSWSHFFEKQDLLATRGNYFETTREWIVLCVCIFLFCLYLFSCQRMYKIYRKINTETVVVTLTTLDVLFDLSLGPSDLTLRIHLPHSALGLCAALSPVLPDVDDCLSFFQALSHRHSLRRTHQYPPTTYLYSHHRGHRRIPHSGVHELRWTCVWPQRRSLLVLGDPYFLLFVVSVQCCGLMLHQELFQRDQKISPIYQEYNFLRMRKTQLLTLTYGYLVLASCNLIWLILQVFEFQGYSIECQQDTYWWPLKQYSAFYLFIKSILQIVPGILIWVVFFWLPWRNSRLLLTENKESIRIMRESSMGERQDSNLSFLEFLIKNDADQLRRFETKNHDSVISRLKPEEEHLNLASQRSSDHEEEPKALVIEYSPSGKIKKGLTSQITTEDFEDNKMNMSTDMLLTLKIAPQTHGSTSQARSTAGSGSSPSHDYKKRYSKKKRVSSKKRTRPVHSFKEEGEIVLKTEEDFWD